MGRQHDVAGARGRSDFHDEEVARLVSCAGQRIAGQPPYLGFLPVGGCLQHFGVIRIQRL